MEGMAGGETEAVSSWRTYAGIKLSMETVLAVP
jgi:hypothetical protein